MEISKYNLHSPGPFIYTRIHINRENWTERETSTEAKIYSWWDDRWDCGWGLWIPDEQMGGNEKIQTLVFCCLTKLLGW